MVDCKLMKQNFFPGIHSTFHKDILSIYPFLFMFLLVLPSCALPPDVTRSVAQKQKNLALDARADQYAIREFREYQFAYRRAQRFQMEEDTKFFPFMRDYTKVVEAYNLARDLGIAARQTSLTKQKEMQEEIQDVIDNASEELHQIRGLINGVSLGRSSGAFLTLAEIRLKQSTNFMSRGEFEKAKTLAVQAMEHIGSVQNRASSALTRYQSQEYLSRWENWVENTVHHSRENGGYAVVVDKSRHTCLLFRAGKVVRTYSVNLGVNGFNQKVASGDLATPEGQYRIIRKQGVGRSRYYKGLMLDYPNSQDYSRFHQAKANRLISSSAKIGGNIMLHGEGGKTKDWTLGCVALSNRDMDDLFSRVPENTPVTIVGRVSGRFSVPVSKSQDIVEKTRELQNKKKSLRLL